MRSIARIVRAGPVVLLAALALADPTSAYDSFTQDLILEVRMKTIQLSDGLFAFERNGRLLVPVVELAETLDFTAEVDIERGYVSGFYLDESRSYSIDIERLEVVRQGEVFKIAENDFIGDDLEMLEELYVDTHVLEKLWPVKLILDMPNLSLLVEPTEKLAIERKKERERVRDMVLARRKGTTELLTFDNSYRPYSAPVVDFDSDVRVGNDRNDSRHSLTATHDLAGFETDWFGSLEREENLWRATDLRLTFNRSEAAGPVPLDFETVQAGDVTLPSLRLVENSRRGRGLVLSSFPDYEADVFDNTTLNGNGIPGWEVELYRNNELIEFQTVGGDGRWEFTDVPLVFGANRLRVVLYGPQGQAREFVEQVVVGAGMAPSGETRMRVAAFEAGTDLFPVGDNPEGLQGFLGDVEVAYGLNERISLFGRTARVPTIRGTETYYMGGLAGSFVGAYGQLELHGSGAGGFASDMRLTAGIGRVRLNGGLTYYNDFTSPAVTTARDMEASGRIDTTFLTPLGDLFMALGSNYEQLAVGNRTTNINTRVSLANRYVRLTHTTNSIFRDSNDRNDSRGDVSLSTGTGLLRLRAGTAYDIHPGLAPDNARASMSYTFDRRWVTSFNFQYAFADELLDLTLVDTTPGDTLSFLDATPGDVEPATAGPTPKDTVTAGFVITRDIGVLLLGVDGSWSSDTGAQFGLRVGMSVGPDKAGRYRVTSLPRTQQGEIRARVFIDRDYDGHYGDGDEALPDVKLVVNTRRTKGATDDDGRILVTELPPLRPLAVRVDDKTLEDPYWVPANNGYRIVTRPGALPQVEFAVIETGAVDGTVFLAGSDRPVPGMSLELVDASGVIVATAVSSYDGFYVFERVRPGAYSVRTSGTSRLMVDAREARVEVDDPFLVGLDLQAQRVEREPVATPEPAAAPEPVPAVEPAETLEPVETLAPGETLAPVATLEQVEMPAALTALAAATGTL